MQKIGSSTSTANAAGEYTEGSPGSGVDATLITAAWLNTIQRELVNLIQGADLALSTTDDSQVLKAVQVLQTAMNTWAKITGKPTTVAGFGITDAFTKTETSSAIQAAVSALVASSPAALDTLKELAAALGNDPNFATTVTNALANKANKATTLAGYGITNALATGNNGAVPSFYNSATDIGGSASVNLREANLVAGTQLGPEYAPCLGFLWSSVVYGRMTMRADGRLYWNSSPMLTQANIDSWAMQPVGALIAFMDNNANPAPPRDNPAYRYIRLTASDPYNAGILTSESVTGVAPLVVATGVVSLAGSVFNGQTVSLINTERRVLRGGLPGVVEQDALQGHFHNVLAGNTAGTGLTSGSVTGGNSLVNDTVPGGGRVQSPASDGVNGAVRIAAETRVKSMGVTYYLRVA